MRVRAAFAAFVAVAVLVGAVSTAAAAEGECTLTPSQCFGIDSVDVSLSSYLAGDHADVTFEVRIAEDPTSKPNSFGLHNGYATTRDIRFNLPPGLIADPNVIGATQQCTAEELSSKLECPNGSQIGIVKIAAYQLSKELREPLYMMQPPGGEVAARLGTVAGAIPTFIDVAVRSEGDYGVVSEVRDAPAAARVLGIQTTLWGVPAHPSHDTERCKPKEIVEGCVATLPRPPGSKPLPFTTNPTQCGVPLEVGVNATSWVEPEFDPNKEVVDTLPPMKECNRLPFGPTLSVQPTSRHTSSPTGLEVRIKAPGASDSDVLEPSHMRDIKVTLPAGLATNPAIGDGLGVCSVDQVRFGKREAAHCPDSAKIASTEFDVPIVERRLKGAIYLREPEPGNPFRIWVVADDLGAHVKLPGQLHLDPVTGQIESIVLDSPQFPLREARIIFKSGFRAPLITPPTCGIYAASFEITAWSGAPPATGDAKMSIDEGCTGIGGFSPKLSAGSTDSGAGRHSPFVFTLTRQDSEQNPAAFDISLPRGIAATFAGVERCSGEATLTGACPAGSRIGKVIAAVGAGPSPLWVPQPGKRPAVVYLATPYKGAPLSIVAVVPRQAGPFDFGDEVVRSAVYVNPITAQATTKTDPLPQTIEGIPIRYRTLHVELDRPNFMLNPTSCAPKATTATVTSSQGAVATAVSPFAVTDCAKLPFKPNLALRMSGGTRRGAHPRLTATLKLPAGGANIAGIAVTLPRSQFVENAHFNTICTRVQFAADACPTGSIYGFATARSPLFDETFSGPAYLRSSSNPLPDLVLALKGPDSLPVEIEVVARVDSAGGRLRSTIETVPDAPLTYATLQMQGGDKGLFVNSKNLCAGPNRAKVQFTGQNGKHATLHSALKVNCKKASRKRKRSSAR